MNIIHGEITKIEKTFHNTDFEKNEVFVKMPDEEECKVEFRGRVMMNLLKGFEPGDIVQVAVKYEGKHSKSSGIYYNNMIAKSIKKS